MLLCCCSEEGEASEENRKYADDDKKDMADSHAADSPGLEEDDGTPSDVPAAVLSDPRSKEVLCVTPIGFGSSHAACCC